MNLSTIIVAFDAILFGFILFSVLYLAVYAIAATFSSVSESQPQTSFLGRILILIPAYKEDMVIESTVRSFLKQNYPDGHYDVVVIADHCSTDTVNNLKQYPISVVTPEFEQSLKAKSLAYAMEHIAPRKYDIVVILDADNTVDSHFLNVINACWQSGSQAIQAHRVAKNLNTDTALLDAISEEINNAIFRIGHIRLGLSSALSGSGMAFSFEWFNRHVNQLVSSGEDKELEAMLLKERIFVDFLPDLYVYDEKTQKEKGFHRQRRRWMASQLHALYLNISNFIPALIGRNYDYADKIIQWMLPPRIVMMGIILVMSVFMFIIDWMEAVKWWSLFVVALGIFAMCIPDKLVNKNFDRAVRRAPLIALKSILNTFRLGGLNNRFLHTEHSYKEQVENPEKKIEKRD